ATPSRAYPPVDMSGALLKSLQEDRGEESLRVLYRTYSGELYGFALSSLGDRGLAEELVQEVFTRVWRHAESYDPDRASFRTWLYGIARNAIIDFKRRGAVRPQLPLHEPVDEPEDEDDPLELAVLRWRCAAEHAELAPLPTMLDLAGSADAVPERPPAALEEAVLDRFARESASRPKRRRWRPRAPRVALRGLRTRPLATAMAGAALGAA